MTERDELREKLAEWLYYLTGYESESKAWLIRWESLDMEIRKHYNLWADQILALETDTCRLAVVRKEPELPKREFYNDWGGESGRISYSLAQQDMLQAGFVQEVSDGG